jgi:hypothetical protein
LLLCVLLSLGSAGAIAQEAGIPDGVVIRVSTKPESGALIGQHLQLFVDVLFPDTMPHPPRVEAPEVSGAQLFRFESQATTMNDQIDGKSYVGQRFEFAFYARRTGTLTIPPMTVTLLDANDNPVGKLQSQPINIEVSTPPGVDASIPVIASTDVKISQEWSQDLSDGFKTGDALKRRITRTADDVPALAMRDFDFTAPDGIRVYVDKPLVEDRIDRGEITGQRVDSVTYLFEKPGNYILPALSQPWIDSDDQSLQSAFLREQKLEVEQGPAGAGSASNELSAAVRRMWPWLLAVALIVLGLSALAWRSGPALIAERQRRQDAYRNSELVSFRQLEDACRTADAGRAYQALHQWLLRAPKELSAHPEIVKASDPLEQALFGGTSRSWSSAEATILADRLRSARQRYLKSRCSSTVLALPPLNPS